MSRRSMAAVAVLLLILLVLFLLTPAGSGMRGRFGNGDDGEASGGSVVLPSSDSSGAGQNASKTERDPSRPLPTREETIALLKKTIIPMVELHGVSWRQALDFMNEQLRQAGVDPRDAHLAFSKDFPDERKDQRAGLTLKLKDVPAATVLDYLCASRKLWWEVGEGWVELAPLRAEGEAGLVESSRAPDPLDVEVSAEDPPALSPAQVAMTTKLEKMVIPSLQMQGATVSEAVDFLRMQSMRLDTNPDPNLRGLNIVIEGRRGQGGDAIVPDWSAENLSFTEALDQFAARTGMEWSLSDFAVQFRAKEEE